jgi:pyridoxamine 5'-phosphate oxidase family protein
MSTSTHTEIQYLNGQPLGRIATVGPHGRPHVMPVAVFYDPETESIVIGIAGDTAASKKFRDAQRRPDVAIVVDDLAAVDPWTPRGIQIRGRGGAHRGRRGGRQAPRRPVPVQRGVDPHPPAPGPGMGHRQRLPRAHRARRDLSETQVRPRALRPGSVRWPNGFSRRTPERAKSAVLRYQGPAPAPSPRCGQHPPRFFPGSTQPVDQPMRGRVPERVVLHQPFPQHPVNPQVLEGEQSSLRARARSAAVPS